MKGYFHNRMKLEFVDAKLIASIYTDTQEEAEGLGEYSGKPCELSEVSGGQLLDGTSYKYCIKWESTDAIDLVAWLNDTQDYSQVLAPLPTTHQLVCKFAKSDTDAVSPCRAHGSDSGYDLTLIKALKTVGDVTFYSTCVSVDPPHGYYFDLVGRSSISKTGYMLANAIGIIDQSYRGDIIVPLRKVDKNAETLTLPAKIVQIIPRQWHHVQMVESSDLESTARGSAGFGSTS